MKVLNFGSLNIDLVYRLPHIVKPGETLGSASLQTFAGGKGANQSMALARAGARVYHAGKIGPDGQWLKKKLAEAGVNTRYLRTHKGPTGHAVIQVDDYGENAIVLFPGANHANTKNEIDETLAAFGPDDFLLLQNEINDIPYIIERAFWRGLRICLNPAPFGKEILKYPLHRVRYLILNETEGEALTRQKDPAKMVRTIAKKWPDCATVLTLGKNGVLYSFAQKETSIKGIPVKAVDTTAAGDTFTGYFLASLLRGKSEEQSLKTACIAGALCVTRSGATDSIPTEKEVLQYKEKLK